MKSVLNKLPYPIAGVMLSFAVLGNLVGQLLGGEIRNVFGIISGCLLLLIILKMVVFPSSVKKAFITLPSASVIATLPMGIMVLATYVTNIQYDIAFVMWVIGFIVNVFVIVSFTIIHVFPFRIEKVLASYFVTYVGIVCASVTAKPFGMFGLGIVAFVFGLSIYMILLPIVTYRYYKKRVEKEALLPLVVIYAAPANLLVVGYCSLSLSWFNELLVILWVIGLLTTFFGWYQMYVNRYLSFYPSFAAYTFPLVIGAVASFNIYKIYANLSYLSYIVQYFAYVQLVTSLLTVFCVLYKYVACILKKS